MKSRRCYYILILLIVIGLVLTPRAPRVAHASLQLGDEWLSSKLLVRAGVADSQLLLARTGVADSFLVLATSPRVTTNAAGAVTLAADGTGTVLLHGTLDSLNGMPQAAVGFRWGYSLGGMVTLTPATNVTSTGAFDFTLTGFDGLSTIYFQAVATSDGVNYGSGIAATATRQITDYTGLETILLVSPFFLWVAILIGSGMSFYVATRQPVAELSQYIFIGIGLALFLALILMFPVVLDLIQMIRSMQ